MTVLAGETVGLIGANGAGKTTTFEMLSGFTTPDRGRVRLNGEDVSQLPPEARARRGLIRSFQDAALFPTMTVSEVVALSLERVDPTRLVPSLLGIGGADRRKQGRARELLGMMGLHGYRNTPTSALSTGTRRITELACLIALEPSVLLLDEPTSGIAQRETEALAGVLQRIKDELDLTLVIIEHDIPLVMSISDRVVAMEAGSIIAAGPPEQVKEDPLVISSYLGGDVRAIERSDAEAVRA
jgi:ABC-type branched-subunit amino acid transport system ATPase component